jgi:uncharacterized protein YwqG
MSKRFSLDFIEASGPVCELITKFGGQPVWITIPEWPLSASTGKPMRFICQIALTPELFGPITARMAYLFMTDDGEYIDGTWDPDGGENAVILQPGHTVLPVQPISTGPTLYRMVPELSQPLLVPQPCEFVVSTCYSEDPEFAEQGVRVTWSETENTQYAETLDGNKVGGTPIFLQSDEFPGPGAWKLLLQLDSTSIPFYLNFGDAGMGYAFISEDGNTGKFLWQCL